MDKMMLPPEKVNSIKSSSFFKPTIQKKLSVGSANDAYEVEADAMADKVMRMQEPQQQNVSHSGALVQRKCTHCEQEEKIQMKSLAENITPLVQRSSTESVGESHAPSHVENQINSLRGGGSAMDHGTKNFMESRFGTDFSGVRIHTGSQAVQMSRELNAQAFTVGNDVYFNEGKYNPNSDSGMHLLAHELTHTVQQGASLKRKIQMQRRGAGGGCTSSNVLNVAVSNFTNRSVTIPSDCTATARFTAAWRPFCNGSGAIGCTGSRAYEIIVTNHGNATTHNLRATQAHCGDAEQDPPTAGGPITLQSGTNNLRFNVHRSGCEGITMDIRVAICVNC